jgi:hypothetical protein
MAILHSAILNFSPATQMIKVEIVKNIPDTAIYLICLGAIQSIFFVLLLLSIREGQAKFNRLLAVLLIAGDTGFISVFGLLISEGHTQSSLFRMMMSASLCCIPLLFLYVKALLQEEFRFSPMILLHFLPVVLVMFYLLIFDRPSFDLADFFTRSSLDHISVIMAIWMFYSLPYLLLIFRMMKKHRRFMANAYHISRTINHAIIYKFRVYLWVRSLLVAGTIYWILIFIFFLYREIPEFYFIIILISTSIIYVLGFLGIRKPEIFFASTVWDGESDKKIRGNRWQ